MFFVLNSSRAQTFLDNKRVFSSWVTNNSLTIKKCLRILSYLQHTHNLILDRFQVRGVVDMWHGNLVAGEVHLQKEKDLSVRVVVPRRLDGQGHFL